MASSSNLRNQHPKDEHNSSGVERQAGPSYNWKLVTKLMDMFPEACPNYLKQLTQNLSVDTSRMPMEILVSYFAAIILKNSNYPKRHQSPKRETSEEELLEVLQGILPNATEKYLYRIACEYQNDETNLSDFVTKALENKSYPTKEEAFRVQRLRDELKLYTTDFTVENFLAEIEDPENYFSDPKFVQCNSSECFEYALQFLKNTYQLLSVKLIKETLLNGKGNLLATAKVLDAAMANGTGLLKAKRKILPLRRNGCQNVFLFQQIAYLMHKKEISAFLQEKERSTLEAREVAEREGKLSTCQCCYDDHVMPSDIQTCERGCAFCKDCIRTSVETAFADGKLDFACLENCSSYFSVRVLKIVISNKLFAKIDQKRQALEIQRANIEDLEVCPFCDFAAIVNPSDKIFQCLNEECMKEICRLCKEPAHVPLRCEEVESDMELKQRKFVEDKMTEALLRKCNQCNRKFIKLDGCNRIRCACGAQMCYICGKPVENYKHFNGLGGDQYHLCPLFSDIHELHKKDVLKSVEEAKKALGIENFKMDPTINFNQYHDDIKKRYPQPHAIETTPILLPTPL